MCTVIFQSRYNYHHCTDSLGVARTELDAEVSHVCQVLLWKIANKF